jgi:hypothetical protein
MGWAPEPPAGPALISQGKETKMETKVINKKYIHERWNKPIPASMVEKYGPALLAGTMSPDAIAREGLREHGIWISPYRWNRWLVESK